MFPARAAWCVRCGGGVGGETRVRVKLLGIIAQGLGFDCYASRDAQPEPISPVQERSSAGMAAKPTYLTILNRVQTPTVETARSTIRPGTTLPTRRAPSENKCIVHSTVCGPASQAWE